jgi:hypothetical protein
MLGYQTCATLAATISTLWQPAPCCTHALLGNKQRHHFAAAVYHTMLRLVCCTLATQAHLLLHAIHLAARAGATSSRCAATCRSSTYRTLQTSVLVRRLAAAAALVAAAAAASPNALCLSIMHKYEHGPEGSWSCFGACASSRFCNTFA